MTPETVELARLLTKNGPLPLAAELDAYHFAVAAVNEINYLLTWNNKHIANASMRLKIEALCRASGYEPPIICSPEELMEKQNVD